MSLSFGCTVPEAAAVVLAADSAKAQYDEGEEKAPVVVYEQCEKLFQLHPSLPIGLMATGLDLPYGVLLEELGKRLAGDDGSVGALERSTYTMQQVAGRIRDLLAEHWPTVLAGPARRKGARVLVAGFGAARAAPEMWVVGAYEHGVDDPRPVVLRGFGIFVDGCTDAVTRLLGGFSPDLIATLSEHVPPDTAKQILETFGRDQMSQYAGRGIPLGDAVEFAEFLVAMTVQFERFKHGPQLVAPPIDIATVTRTGGFRWIRRKAIYSASLEAIAP